MKPIQIGVARIYLTFLFLLTSLVTFAQNGGGNGQDGDLDVHVDVGGEDQAVWYGQWWIWAIGIALFIIIIVAIVSAGRKRD